MLRIEKVLGLAALLALASACSGDDGDVDAGINPDAGTLQCGSAETLCGTSCVDTDLDPRHCGACDNACAAGDLCTAGQCETSCGAGLTECSGTCRDLMTDRNHCGGCNQACAAGEICMAGACEISCGDGQIECASACVDPTENRSHCGGCGIACAADEICGPGGCTLLCASGLSECDGACRDTDSDRNHCGGCNQACSDGEVCTGGTCTLVCAGFADTECNGACTNLDTDPANCGACGTACGTGEVCDTGTCTTLEACTETLCGNVCTNVDIDPSNCSACGNACPTFANAAAVCGAGNCGAICLPEYADCDGDLADVAGTGCETNLPTSVDHCGACGNACPVPANAAAACVNGACGLGACLTGFDDCDTDPTNGCESELAADALNCGACGNACPMGQVCTSGACVVGVPGGENCSDPLDVVAGDNIVTWMASNADYLVGVPSCVSVGTLDGPDVVLRYTPNFSGSVDFTIFDKPTSTRWVVLISDLTCGTYSPELACLSDWSPATFGGEITVTAGTTYYLYVSDTSSGTLPLSNPFSLRITEIDCATLTSSVTAVSPAAGQTTSTLSPDVTIDFGLAVSRTGTVTLTGNLGTTYTYVLSGNPTGASWSNGDTTLTLTPPAAFQPGEQVTASVTGMQDARCGNAVPAASWAFTIITPPCNPGAGGLVGSTLTRVPTGIASFTEYYVVADDAPNGYVYSGGTTALWRYPKAGGAAEDVDALASITSSQLGYDMVIDGSNIYVLDQTITTTGLLWRISSDGGATFAAEDVAVFPTAPDDDLRTVAAYGGRIFMMTHESTTGVGTQIWSVTSTATGAAPDTARLEVTFPYLECTGLAVDDQFYYTICDDGSDPVVRVDRATGATAEITTAFDASLTKNALVARDLDADGVADVLYVQTAREEGYFVCEPDGATPYADTLWSFGTGTSNYGLGFDAAANVLWSIDDGNRDLLRIQ